MPRPSGTLASLPLSMAPSCMEGAAGGSWGGPHPMHHTSHPCSCHPAPQPRGGATTLYHHAIPLHACTTACHHSMSPQRYPPPAICYVGPTPFPPHLPRPHPVSSHARELLAQPAVLPLRRAIEGPTQTQHMHACMHRRRAGHPPCARCHALAAAVVIRWPPDAGTGNPRCQTPRGSPAGCACVGGLGRGAYL